MARPKKSPEDRRSERVDIPVTVAEKRRIQDAARSGDEKPVTWAREDLLKSANRKLS
jgi:hypothetical protein